MALWASVYPSADTGDRDPSFCWPDTDGVNLGDSANDMFADFIDFEVGLAENGLSHQHNAESFFVDTHQGDGSGSSGVSTTGDFDFLSSGSNIGHSMSTASYDVAPNALSLYGAESQNTTIPDQHEYFGRTSVSDTELERLEDISLYSPKKSVVKSEPSSPTPPNTTVQSRKSKKFVEAISSTIRKATALRKSKKGNAHQKLMHPISPALEQPQGALKQCAARRVQTHHASVPPRLPVSPPPQIDTTGTGFIHGLCDDPFNAGDISPTHTAPPMRYYSQGGLGTPIDSPTRKSEPDLHNRQQAHANLAHWQTMEAQQQNQWSFEYTFNNQSGQWTSIEHSDVDINVAMQAQHQEQPFDHTQSHGLMIHMPQPRPSQSDMVNELTLNAQTYLPPPPPVPASERFSRPPRAPSSGTRHRNMSSSPMRKQRGPSASPTPTQSQRQSRHSSGGSISSIRSASGRLPGSMPGTPCSVRKRRSRDAGSLNLSNSVDESSGGVFGGGGGGIGFVNFTPSDGTVLMTGVAPSGSSKTKARREKEAQERRRRLSEAAMKAVAAAGGDIQKLKEQGFEF